MTDSHNSSYRSNVAMIVADGRGRVALGQRIAGGWQFPQGGIDNNENADEAMYRELNEEMGLTGQQVRLVARSTDWLRYDVPESARNKLSTLNQRFRGQHQRWYLLQLLADDAAIHLDSGDFPEFGDWQWVSYWYPLSVIVYFKRLVYRKALSQFAAAHSCLCTEYNLRDEHAG